MATRAAIWARVSTDRQETANQARELRAWAERRGLDVGDRVYLVTASATKGRQEKDLDRAIEDARQGRYQVLLVWATDRLSRGPIRTVLDLLHRFELAGAQVWSYQEPEVAMITDPDLRDMFRAFRAFTARMETRRLGERTRAGVERARAEGKRLGRPPRRKAVTEHRRWTEVRDLVLDGKISRAQGAKMLRVRYETFTAALPLALGPSEKGGQAAEFGEAV